MENKVFSRSVLDMNLESLVEIRQDKQSMEFHKLEDFRWKEDVGVVNSPDALFTRDAYFEIHLFVQMSLHST